MAAAHFYDPDREWPSLAAHLRRGCLVARVPFMAPPLPAAYVPRPLERGPGGPMEPWQAGEFDVVADSFETLAQALRA